MSDLPKPYRIWLDEPADMPSASGTWYARLRWGFSDRPGQVEYHRADLSAPVGFSREQIEALKICDKEPMPTKLLEQYRLGYNHAIFDILDEEPNATLTPAAKDPEVLVLVKALKRIASETASEIRIGPYDEDLTPALESARDLAREALTAWKGGKNGAN